MNTERPEPTSCSRLYDEPGWATPLLCAFVIVLFTIVLGGLFILAYNHCPKL